jgi:hypothetical protein
MKVEDMGEIPDDQVIYVECNSREMHNILPYQGLFFMMIGGLSWEGCNCFKLNPTVMLSTLGSLFRLAHAKTTIYFQRI